MSCDESPSFRPVGMGKVESIHHDSQNPISSDEQSQPERTAVAAEKFCVQDESKCAEANDRRYCECPVHPHQLSVEWHELLKVLPPAQPEGNLKAPEKQGEVAGPSQP